MTNSADQAPRGVGVSPQGKAKQAALEGWFSMDSGEPHLIGSQCESCGTYYFPRQTAFCRNPDCQGESFADVPLSRTGKLWSFTNACYQPPEPYIAAEPYEPFTIAAVELDKEKMVVLGQVVRGVEVKDLQAGMAVEIVLEPLYEDDNTEHLIWKWKPLNA
jgi:uncharacterized OB-fold protein